MNRLNGKIALVTGASTGLGLATAQLFAQEGAFVYMTGRRQKEIDAAAAAVGPNARAVRGDIAKLSDLDALFEQIRREKGRLDVLFANAGGGELAPLGEISEAHFDSTFGTNVKGTLFTVQKALPLMPEGASIILNASMMSIKGMPAFGVYAATKAAVRSFARAWILDLKPRHIRVNVVSPGPVPTPGYDHLGLTENQMEEWIESQRAAIPLGRVGRPEEVAKAVLFLATDESSFVNGAELFVDGGLGQI